MLNVGRLINGIMCCVLDFKLVYHQHIQISLLKGLK